MERSFQYYLLQTSAMHLGITITNIFNQFFGFDLLKPNIDLLQDGTISFLLNQNPKRQGYLSIKNLLNHFIYNKAIPSKIYLPIDIVVKENYLHYVKEEESMFESLI